MRIQKNLDKVFRNYSFGEENKDSASSMSGMESSSLPQIKSFDEPKVGSCLSGP